MFRKKIINTASSPLFAHNEIYEPSAKEKTKITREERGSSRKGKKKRPGKERERVHATLGTLSGITGTFEDTGIKEA